MTTKKVFEDKDTRVYERKDDAFIIGSGATDYKAQDKHSSAQATGKSVAEAVGNLRSGSSGSDSKQ